MYVFLYITIAISKEVGCRSLSNRSPSLPLLSSLSPLPFFFPPSLLPPFLPPSQGEVDDCVREEMVAGGKLLDEQLLAAVQSKHVLGEQLSVMGHFCNSNTGIIRAQETAVLAS